MSPNPTRIGPFTVVRPIGRGKDGVVLEIRTRHTGERFALKVFKGVDTEFVERLRRLLPALRAVDHPNVVRVYDVVELEGQPGLVMDLVQGPSLHEALAHGAFTPEQVDHLGRGLLAGLRAVHDAGLLHRSLGPRSVVLEVRDSGPVPKLIDQGLASILHPLDAPPVPGPYRSPEDSDGDPVDERADLYAAGAVLYELLVGTGALDDGEVAARIASGHAEPVAGLPECQIEAVARALRADLDQRAQTAGELLAVWENRGEDGTGRVAPKRAWDEATVERLRDLWTSRVPVEVTLDDFVPPSRAPEPFRPGARHWVVLGVALLVLGSLVAWAA